MVDKPPGYGRIRVRYFTREESLAKYGGRVRYYEEKYGMSSSEMRALISTGDDKWETLEVLRWMSADRIYQSLLEDEVPAGGEGGVGDGGVVGEG